MRMHRAGTDTSDALESAGADLLALLLYVEYSSWQRWLDLSSPGMRCYYSGHQLQQSCMQSDAWQKLVI